jgi:ribonuclease P protein component
MEGAPWRLGLTATRQVGHAVVRNRARRRVREFFRRRNPWVPEGWDFVVNLKRGATRACAGEFNLDLCRTLRRLGFDQIPTD